MKNDYDNTPKEKWISKIWKSIKEWLVNLLANILIGIGNMFEKLSYWSLSDAGSTIMGLFIAITVSGCIGAGCFAMAKCDHKRTQQIERSYTVDDSTFIEKQDGMYIYRRTVDGHQMYLMTDHHGTKQFVHSPNCDCDTIQYVP